MKFHNLFCLLIAAGLSACSAALVPLSFDPKTKLGQAYQLLYEFDRPLPAERLIQEAYDIYRERGDEEGMGEAYRLYGSFFIAGSVSRWSQTYMRAGFLDGSSYVDRFRTSAAYLDKASAHFMKAAAYGSATNAQLVMGFSYIRAGEIGKACLAYDQSLDSYRKNVAANPGLKVALPDGFFSYEDVIRDAKTRAECA